MLIRNHLAMIARAYPDAYRRSGVAGADIKALGSLMEEREDASYAPETRTREPEPNPESIGARLKRRPPRQSEVTERDSHFTTM